ncbi:hypothetical protein AC579_2260 [Pseudocercospora musae]|uniref:Ig-like domain-containing protein n=1 Tax=Pseudocercospora musae TaxID=113226 RepID=A0A139IUU3_9PEZI|nr:hypothetical protein AC579_2260 [Pseudocercospora musae]KXT18483.1 hypothetical protein AC579_2260 [Pseudocercospora musae]
MSSRLILCLVWAAGIANAANTLCKGGLAALAASKLAGFQPASAYCSSKYPLPLATSTSTAATTTLTATAQAVKITTTVATVSITTFYSTDTATETATVTATTTIEVPYQVQKRDLNNEIEKRMTTLQKEVRTNIPRAPANTAAPIWASLLVQSNKFIASVCTCLETQVTKAVTITPSTTATVTPRSTQQATETDTISSIAQVTTTTTSTTTQTSTKTTLVTCSNPTPTFYLRTNSGQYVYQDGSHGYANQLSSSPGSQYYIDGAGDLHTTEDNSYASVGDTTSGGTYGSVYFEGGFFGFKPSDYRHYTVVCSLDSSPVVQGVPKSISCAVNGGGPDQFYWCGDFDDSWYGGLSLSYSDPGLSQCSAITLQAIPTC